MIARGLRAISDAVVVQLNGITGSPRISSRRTVNGPACERRAETDLEHNGLCDLFLGELDALYRFAHHLCKEPEEAEFLVYEAYSRAFKSAGTFHLSNLGTRPWLFKILHKVISSRYAEQYCEACSVAHPEAASNISADQGGTSHLDLASLDLDNMDARLGQALNSLPWSTRATFMLWAVEELTYPEIAEVTDVPLDIVTRRLHGARADVYARRLREGGSVPMDARVIAS